MLELLWFTWKDLGGSCEMKNLRRLICKVTPQTLWNLQKLAKMMRYGDNLGKVVDKLVREKMISLKDWGDLR